MRSGPIALRAAGAAAAVLVLGPTAGVAYAHDGVKVRVSPATAKPGADIDIRVSGCKGTTGAARSDAFVADAELSGRDGGDRPLIGDTTLKSGLADGTYRITVTCDGHDHRDVGTVQVERKQKPTHRPTHRPTHQPTQQPTHRPTHRPTHHETPFAPVRAGGGGAAALAAPGADSAEPATVEEQGPGTPHTLVGLGLAGVAAVAVAFRHSRRRASAGAHANGRKDAE
ncbi:MULTISPECIES: PT domain-containing protein [Streptomyces]|uniref:PT domain-containing protein n=1 Tax=Streptomyces solicathayae TaxID=3081768 RepID=A0ABZ0LXB4_9ACTN|nr:PT domain-containing protein [Streptomyces sp. HUAS YS2]WOX24172.1 PT domain-containing protein [Streptomyces sp. HUAS YS2]